MLPFARTRACTHAHTRSYTHGHPHTQVPQIKLPPSAPAPEAATAQARGPGLLDLDRMRELATLDRKYWTEIHSPGTVSQA